MPDKTPTFFDTLGDAVSVGDALQYAFAAYKAGKYLWNAHVRRHEIIPWLVERTIRDVKLSPTQRIAVLEQLRNAHLLNRLNNAKSLADVRHAIAESELPDGTQSDVEQAITGAMRTLWTSEGTRQESVLLDESLENKQGIQSLQQQVQILIDAQNKNASAHEIDLDPISLRNLPARLERLGVEQFTMDGRTFRAVLKTPAQLSIRIDPGNIRDQQALGRLLDGTLDEHAFESRNGVTFNFDHPILSEIFGSSAGSPETVIVRRNRRVTKVERLLEFRTGTERFALRSEIAFDHDARQWTLAVRAHHQELYLRWVFDEHADTADCQLGIRPEQPETFLEDLRLLRLMVALGVNVDQVDVYDTNLEQLLLRVSIPRGWQGNARLLFAQAEFLANFIELNHRLGLIGIEPLPYPTAETQHDRIFQTIPVLLTAIREPNREWPRSVVISAEDLEWNEELRQGVFPNMLNVHTTEYRDSMAWLDLLLHLDQPTVRFFAPGRKRASKIRELNSFRDEFPKGTIVFDSRKSTAALSKAGASSVYDQG